jgi:transposase-like protein
VTASAQYEVSEERAIRDARAAGEKPVCPRCSVPMTLRTIGGGSFGLGYSRSREWLLCPECRRSVIFDFKRGTRT